MEAHGVRTDQAGLLPKQLHLSPKKKFTELFNYVSPLNKNDSVYIQQSFHLLILLF